MGFKNHKKVKYKMNGEVTLDLWEMDKGIIS
jgi:hypothetical protein